MQLHGAGFIVTREQAVQLGLGRVAGLERPICEYRNGRDLAALPRDALVIDLFDLTADDACSRFPEVFQWVHNHVKPERDAKGGTLEDRPRSNKTLCFDPFPFPTASEAQQTRIRDLATQAQAVRAALAAPTDAATLAKTFKGANTDRLKDILKTLASLGQARALAGGQSVEA